MAPELLNQSTRLPSADIFSFGLSLYELCYSEDQLQKGFLNLPYGGIVWQSLRNGTASAVVGRPVTLTKIISRCMQPIPTDRPLPSDLLQMPDVLTAVSQPDPTLCSADIALYSCGNVAMEEI